MKWKAEFRKTGECAEQREKSKRISFFKMKYEITARACVK